MNLNDICFPRVAISALWGLDYLVSASFLALFDLFLLERKILHHSIIHSHLLQKLKPWSFFCEEKQLIRSHSSTINLYRSHTLPCRWIISSLPIFFLIMLIYALFLFSTREFFVGDMLGSGVISNDWQCYDENEDLLCTIGTYWYRVSLHQFSLSLFCREIHISTPNLLSLYSTLWRR